MTKPVLALTAAAAALLLPTATLAESMYGKSSPVLQVDGGTYQSLIAKSNYTSIVEFYAPWCGHCKNLKPAYEKAAKSLSGLAKVAAINCDDEANKPFCGSMGVQGFPTLKIVKPGKKPGRPFVEDYQGARTAKGIVDAVVDKIPNHVKRLKDGDYSDWLEGSDKPKAILFTEKGTVSALLKSVAIEFLGSVEVAQVRDKEKEAVEVFAVTKFPTLVLVPGDEKDPVIYDGEMKKDAIVKFLSQSATPNPDPAPKEKKSKSGANKSKAPKPAPADAKEKKKASTAKPSPTDETLEDADPSPDPQVDTPKPVEPPTIEAIPTLTDGLALQQTCLNTASKTCILALLPPATDPAHPAVSALSEIHHKHAHARRHLFPFYQIPAANPELAPLVAHLALAPERVEVVAINGKKGWYRVFPGPSHGREELEAWIDALRMGDLPKRALPAGVVADAETLPREPVVVVPAAAEGGPEEGDVTVEEGSGEGYEAMVEEAKRAGKEREGKEGGEAKCPFGHDKGEREEEEGHDEL